MMMSGGQCKQIYKNSKSGFNDCVDQVTCIHEQNVFVDNEVRFTRRRS